MAKESKLKIKSRSYYANNKISKDAKRINEEETLSDDLGIYRLASLHKDLKLAKEGLNIIVVNLKISFVTKSDKEVEHTIPIVVTQDNGKEVLASYSGSEVDEEAFSKFYLSLRKQKVDFNRQSHYHSEPFFVYYLCSNEGQRFLKREFKKKGLIVRGEEKNERGNWPLLSNVKKITQFSLDIHSTKVVCFNCSPFLRDSTPKLLDVLYNRLSLGRIPNQEKLKTINFNVSANQNFNWTNISRNKTFDHIPVLEDEKSDILTRTDEKLTPREVVLQKTGESSNRTFFLSGSNSLSEEVLKIRAEDEANWQQITNNASLEVQKVFRGHIQRKILPKLKDELNYNISAGESIYLIRDVVRRIKVLNGEWVLQHDNSLLESVARYRSIHGNGTDDTVEVVKLLINSGSDPKHVRENGFSLLHKSALYGNINFATFLIQDLNLNINQLTKDGRTPLDLAMENGQQLTSGFLQELGAKTGDEIRKIQQSSKEDLMELLLLQQQQIALLTLHNKDLALRLDKKDEVKQKIDDVEEGIDNLNIDEPDSKISKATAKGGGKPSSKMSEI